ncbi:MAG: hypothetical protein PHH28_03965 [Desulfuromonadaceae bacterium]|nr:hypothetical protein [Desulfuromonadaceae bacterium]
MKIRVLFAVVVVIILVNTDVGFALETESLLEKSMSDTLDLWREGQYERLFEQLAHRGKTSRESFVEKMRESSIHPVCCWQKMEQFRIINEKQTEATVYVKLGLEGTPYASGTVTREFKLTHQEGVWKMQLADVFSIAGVTGKKRNGTKRYIKKINYYN